MIPPTDPEVLEVLTRVDGKMRQHQQIPILTEHVLHAGMYARTVTMPPGSLIAGTFIKIPTIVITVGTGRVLVGRDWKDVEGYKVLPASAFRKQMFMSKGPLVITMIFPTSARTVEEAECEFTDEYEVLLSRSQPEMCKELIGETKCLE